MLQSLAVALGLATLSGFSFYLTVFATGLAIRFEWIQLAPQYESLAALGSTTVLVVSGVLFFLEFFVDKVPWVDSIWDAVHSIIRPFGGAFLAVETLGHPNTIFDVLFGILAGACTFAAHSVKAGTRLIVNQSPEPYSNVVVSLAEEALVVAALAVLWTSPVAAFLALIVAFSVLVYYLPAVWRAIRIRIWFIVQKLNQPPGPPLSDDFPRRLPSRFNQIFRRLKNDRPRTISWAALCVSARGKQIGRNRFGYLVATEEDRTKVFFLTRTWLRGRARMFEIENFEVSFEPRFLYDELQLLGSSKRQRYTFKFDRGRATLAARIAADLEARAKRAKDSLPALSSHAPSDAEEPPPAGGDPAAHREGSTPGQVQPGTASLGSSTATTSTAGLEPDEPRSTFSFKSPGNAQT